MSTTISWTDNSSNPLKARRISDGKLGWFCRKLDDSCLRCYSATQNRVCGSNPGRHGTGHDFKLSEAQYLEPWLNEAELLKISRARKPKKWFVCDMTDFGLKVGICANGHTWESPNDDDSGLCCPKCDGPTERYFWPEWMAMKCLDAWYAAACNGQIIQILSKRPHRILHYLDTWHRCNPLAPRPVPGWWIGTSLGSAAGKPRLDLLRKIPAAVRFVSAEPLIEDLGKLDFSGIHQVIVGSESGTGARPMETAWAENVHCWADYYRCARWHKQFSTSSGKKIEDPRHWPPGDWPQEFPAVTP